MAELLDLERLLRGCGDESFDDGLLIETELEPVAGAGAPVKPAVYEGGRYQRDRRWASPDDDEPQDVIVIDNVPSQANRLEEQLRKARERCGLPEIVLDLSDMDWMPAHLPRQLSSFQFPHRNADAYLRDASLDGQPFGRTDIGEAIFRATPWDAGALTSWFPQALLYGFWQSHLGKKRHQTKHARAWVSEILGWQPGPGADDTVTSLGLKGDLLNLSVDENAVFDPNDQAGWRLGEKPEKGEDKKKLSELGHGQVPFMTDGDAAPAGVSFRCLTQRVSLSFAQLRRVGIGIGSQHADAAARALVASIGIHAHVLAFGRGFALRSGAELRPTKVSVTWLSSNGDEAVDLGGYESTQELVQLAKDAARAASVPLDGWDREPLELRANDALRRAIEATWPNLDT